MRWHRNRTFGVRTRRLFALLTAMALVGTGLATSAAPAHAAGGAMQGPIPGRYWASHTAKVGVNGVVVSYATALRNFDPAAPTSPMLMTVYQKAPGGNVPVVRTIDGQFPTGGSYPLAVSPETGTQYTLYSSAASNIVASDSNGKQDVFLFNRTTAATERVSVGTGGVQANGDTFRAGMSGNTVNGNPRYIVFASNASNLDAIDEQGRTNVFLRDRQTNTTTLITKGLGGAASNGDAYTAVVSDDGNTVAFASTASNLVAGDTNATSDVFAWKRTTGVNGQITRVSVGSQGEGFGPSTSPAISADGRFIAFDSDADELIPDDDNLSYDVLVRDLQYDTLERVSVGTNGEQGDGGSELPSISRDGRYVAFETDVEDWNVDDVNISVDVYVRDRLTRTTQRASEKSNGLDAFSDSVGASISPDGRYVGFDTDSGDFFYDSDLNDDYDVYVKDMSTQFWNAAPTGSRFQTIAPTRVLDTIAAGTKLTAGTARDITVAGGATGVPISATAVLLNLVATNETASGADLVAYPTGEKRPKLSTLNPQVGAPVSNQVAVKVGTSGRVSLFTSTGATDVVADVVGYYAPDAGYGFTPVIDPPVLDTRSAPVPAGWPVWQPLQHGTARATLTIPVAGVGSVPSDARAVTLQVASLNPTTPGARISAYPSGTPNHGMANALPQPGHIITNLVVVPVGANGAVSFTIDAGSAHLLVGVVGFYGPSGRDLFFPLVPARAFDSASTAPATAVPGLSGQLPAVGLATLPVGGRAGVPANARGASLVVTSAGATGPGVLLTWPVGLSPQAIAQQSSRQGSSAANTLPTGLGDNGSIIALNLSGSGIVLTGDAYGYFR